MLQTGQCFWDGRIKHNKEADSAGERTFAILRNAQGLAYRLWIQTTNNQDPTIKVEVKEEKDMVQSIMVQCHASGKSLLRSTTLPQISINGSSPLVQFLIQGNDLRS